MSTPSIFLQNPYFTLPRVSPTPLTFPLRSLNAPTTTKQLWLSSVSHYVSTISTNHLSSPLCRMWSTACISLLYINYKAYRMLTNISLSTLCYACWIAYRMSPSLTSYITPSVLPRKYTIITKLSTFTSSSFSLYSLYTLYTPLLSLLFNSATPILCSYVSNISSSIGITSSSIYSF